MIGVTVVELVDDGMDENGLFVNGKHRVCWDGHPVICKRALVFAKGNIGK